MDAQHPTRPGRKVKWALAVSLALNLLFVGLISGAALRHGGAGGKGGYGGPQMSSYAAPYVQALPRADRRALHRGLRASGALPDRKARRAMYQDVLKGLRADPFEASAVQAALGQQMQSVQGAQAAAQTAWLRVVSEMSASARLSYADALEERLKRGPRHRRYKKQQN